MFTGIITAVGELRRVEEADGLRRLTIATPPGWISGAEVGDSVAVDGACLTLVEVEEEGVRVEVVRSTLDRTVAGSYRVGHRVNLEKALRVGDRLDGHWVQGHVDGMARFLELREEGETRFFTFALPRGVWGATILHGSLALNGVSLTVNRLESPDRCEIALIPHSWRETNFSTLEPGDRVNVEGDMMGKYARKLLGPLADLASRPSREITPPRSR